uniref:Solute carrier family 35 member B1 n=1 Tax=Dicyema japonicum TaxID=399803 RepID=B9ZYY0_DICJA|nr:solute carrier family 35 member B1 [Dicyema japonicum]
MDSTKRKFFFYLFYFTGIFFSYLIYGYFQEKITKTVYISNNARVKFEFPISLVFCLCLSSFLTSLLSNFVIFGKFVVKSEIPIYYFVSCALTYVCAMISSNASLKYVSYPAQVLAKSVKPISVLFIGVLIGRKRYSIHKYIAVFILVLGIVLFFYKPDDSKTNSDSWPIFLLTVSLLFDGFTGGIQDRIKSFYKLEPLVLMLNMNFWSSIALFLVILYTGEVWRFLEFLKLNPRVILQICGAAVTSSIGQLFIFGTIAHMGPLICSIYTTTRKFFTIVISVIIFGNKLMVHQWISTCIVFAGLAYDSFFGKGIKHS